jgi:hypothetical protein
MIGKCGLERTPALDQINNQHHNRDDEQDVDESAQRVGADQAEQPEHKQDNKDSPKHKSSFRVEFNFASFGNAKLRLSNGRFCAKNSGKS